MIFVHPSRQQHGRALTYLGQPVLLDNLLFEPDSALIRQSYMPMMPHIVPEYSMIYADASSGRPTVEIHYLS